MSLALAALLGFLLGSIPWALVVGRSLAGVDVRRHGSGNLGATNVFRVLGPRAGLLVLALDMAKGAVAVLLSRFTGDGSGTLAAGLGAVLGHVFSPWVRFRGGKGVATAGGAFLALAPGPTMVALAVWGIVFAISRYVSLASIAAAVALPFALRGSPGAVRWLGLAVAALVILRHLPNMKRLLAGTESRVRFGRKGAAS